MDARKITHLDAAGLAKLDSPGYIHRLLHANGWLARPDVDDHGDAVTISHNGMDMTGARRALGPWMSVKLADGGRQLRAIPHVWITHARAEAVKARVLTTRAAHSKTLSVVLLDTARVRQVPVHRLSATPHGRS